MYALSARGETPRTPPLNHSFNLVVGKVNRVLMHVYSHENSENEKATFLTGQVLDYPGTIPYCDFRPNKDHCPVHVMPFDSVTYLPGEWMTFR